MFLITIVLHDNDKNYWLILTRNFLTVQFEHHWTREYLECLLFYNDADLLKKQIKISETRGRRIVFIILK